MKTFQIAPEICLLHTVEEFLAAFVPGEGDLVFASSGTQKRALAGKLTGATVISGSVEYR